MSLVTACVPTRPITVIRLRLSNWQWIRDSTFGLNINFKCDSIVSGAITFSQDFEPFPDYL